ncbi:MAG: hypothetical protein AB7S69_17475 [Salinivirgaceae bacterium]
MRNKIFRILSFVIILGGFVMILKLQTNYHKGLNDKYPLITKEDNLNSRITSLNKIKGECFIETKDNSFGISSSQNYDYKSEYIHNNIFVGDSIVKMAGSDTIYIYGQEGVKYFVHQQVINRP